MSETVAKSHMKCLIDLDWCTYVCPCGQEICSRYKSDESLKSWRASHAPHTSGILHEITTPDGARAWGTPVPDVFREIATWKLVSLPPPPKCPRIQVQVKQDPLKPVVNDVRLVEANERVTVLMSDLAAKWAESVCTGSDDDEEGKWETVALEVPPGAGEQKVGWKAEVRIQIAGYRCPRLVVSASKWTVTYTVIDLDALPLETPADHFLYHRPDRGESPESTHHD